MTLYTLTAHAKDRVRQRFGIDREETQLAWVNRAIAQATTNYPQGAKTVFVTDSSEIVCDGRRVVTLKPIDNEKTYLSQLSGALAKEVRKLLIPQERLLRKAEIRVAELTLNFLKARNPKTKSIINDRLIEATDEKQRIADEVFAIKKAAKMYGIEE